MTFDLVLIVAAVAAFLLAVALVWRIRRARAEWEQRRRRIQRAAIERWKRETLAEAGGPGTPADNPEPASGRRARREPAPESRPRPESEPPPEPDTPSEPGDEPSGPTARPEARRSRRPPPE